MGLQKGAGWPERSGPGRGPELGSWVGCTLTPSQKKRRFRLKCQVTELHDVLMKDVGDCIRVDGRSVLSGWVWVNQKVPWTAATWWVPSGGLLLLILRARRPPSCATRTPTTWIHWTQSTWDQRGSGWLCWGHSGEVSQGTQTAPVSVHPQWLHPQVREATGV